jgi:hypothetical protein
MGEPQYKILEADDGSFTVEDLGGDGTDAAITKFDSRKQAVDWVKEERRRLGIDERWQEAADE